MSQNKLALASLLDRSVQVLKEALDSEDEMTRVAVAKYVTDQVIGKPTPRNEDPSGQLVAGTAAALAQTLRAVITAPAEQRSFETVEGTIHVLGEPNTAALLTSAAYEEFDA